MKILSKLDNTGMIDEVTDKRFVTDAEKSAWNSKADKTYVDNKVKTDVPVDAKFTDTVYTHPASHPASMITESSTKRFVSDAEKSTWNSKASKSVASTLADGLMASADKSKLDGIQAGAQVNTVTSVAGKTGAVTLSKADVETALGFTPFNPDGGITTKRKETMIYYVLDTPDTETNIDISASDTIVVLIDANNVVINFDNANTTVNTNDTVRMIYANEGFDSYINHGVIVNGSHYMPQYGGDMYRIPYGMGVIEFDFIAMEFEGMVEPVALGTTGGGGISIDDLHDILYDIDARSLNGYTQADFVLTVYHGTNEYEYRPWDASVVMWIGTVEPYYALDNDIWIGG